MTHFQCLNSFSKTMGKTWCHLLPCTLLKTRSKTHSFGKILKNIWTKLTILKGKMYKILQKLLLASKNAKTLINFRSLTENYYRILGKMCQKCHKRILLWYWYTWENLRINRKVCMPKLKNNWWKPTTSKKTNFWLKKMLQIFQKYSVSKTRAPMNFGVILTPIFSFITTRIKMV